MSCRVDFTPVFLATRRGEEPARLVLADERIVAILVPISPEDNEGGQEGWYLEVGFGPCAMEGLLFPSLAEAEVWVREQLGDRSEQRFPGAEGKLPGARQEQFRVPGEGAARSLRVLVAEDDGLQALELEAQLEGLGHEVVGMVASGPAALAAAETHRPDLVLMDVRLANGTNGIDAAAEIRQRLGILSIFMTAHSDPETRTRLEQVRSLDLLAKPVSPAAVAAALQRAAHLPPMNVRPC